MFTTDELNLAQDRLKLSFFTAARQLKIDQAKISGNSPGQVNIIQLLTNEALDMM